MNYSKHLQAIGDNADQEIERLDALRETVTKIQSLTNTANNSLDYMLGEYDKLLSELKPFNDEYWKLESERRSITNQIERYEDAQRHLNEYDQIVNGLKSDFLDPQDYAKLISLGKEAKIFFAKNKVLDKEQILAMLIKDSEVKLRCHYSALINDLKKNIKLDSLSKLVSQDPFPTADALEAIISPIDPPIKSRLIFLTKYFGATEKNTATEISAALSAETSTKLEGLLSRNIKLKWNIFKAKVKMRHRNASRRVDQETDNKFLYQLVDYDSLYPEVNSFFTDLSGGLYLLYACDTLQKTFVPTEIQSEAGMHLLMVLSARMYERGMAIEKKASEISLDSYKFINQGILLLDILQRTIGMTYFCSSNPTRYKALFEDTFKSISRSISKPLRELTNQIKAKGSDIDDLNKSSVDSLTIITVNIVDDFSKYPPVLLASVLEEKPFNEIDEDDALDSLFTYLSQFVHNCLHNMMSKLNSKSEQAIFKNIYMFNNLLYLKNGINRSEVFQKYEKTIEDLVNVEQQIESVQKKYQEIWAELTIIITNFQMKKSGSKVKPLLSEYNSKLQKIVDAHRNNIIFDKDILEMLTDEVKQLLTGHMQYFRNMQQSTKERLPGLKSPEEIEELVHSMYGIQNTGD